jgi:2-polyprenyl-3-methyl-5-hydroxy-6-metoxy-1,4-benzoquinol methylase
MNGTGERVVVEDYRSTPEQYLIYLFHAVSYRFAERWTEGREVLDCGCGSGYGTAGAAAGATSVVGVDVSRQAIEHARANFSAPNLAFEPTEEEQPLPFPDRSFDTVLSFQVIEHVRHPDAHLSEIRRVLRPDGHLVLTTPDRRTRLFPAQRPWNRWHRTEYGERSLRRLLTPHFDAVELLGMSGSEDVLGIELRRTRRARWLMLPATLPLYPDRVRTRALAQVQRLREARASRSAAPEPRDFDFDESALRIAPGAWPAVNLVAVAQR